MSGKLIGNHRAGGLNAGPQGIGASAFPVGLGWVSGVGKAGDSVIIFLTSLINSGINQGIYIQVPGGASAQFTLANPGEINDLTGAGGVWGNTTAIAANTITPAPVLFTAMKLTLTADGAFYIATR